MAGAWRAVVSEDGGEDQRTPKLGEKRSRTMQFPPYSPEVVIVVIVYSARLKYSEMKYRIIREGVTALQIAIHPLYQPHITAILIVDCEPLRIPLIS